MKTHFLGLLLFMVSIITSQSWAQESSGGSRPWLLSQGAAAREAKRFTLQSWLENKDRRALMDMWLTINTPSPYEFIIGGSMNTYSQQTTMNSASANKNYKNFSGEASAYARFVGVTGEYLGSNEEGFSDTTGIFNLRVFGNSVQSSHITLHYGLRTRIADNGTYRINQQFPAATLQVYLMKYFGIQGNYRIYLPTSESFYGDTQADELNAGAFIEFGSFRLFGDYFQERQNSKKNNIDSGLIRTGTKVGLKIYF